MTDNARIVFIMAMARLQIASIEFFCTSTFGCCTGSGDMTCTSRVLWPTEVGGAFTPLKCFEGLGTPKMSESILLTRRSCRDKPSVHKPLNCDAQFLFD
ncbi:hypothetical protein Mp_1g09870 [Marchantia polymorpha subsp. ruderalis]|uniref:Secreted protein n=2 Tax=Marchantia polymorpha TaxID=3197 RepID=A0AAF6ANF2_MARPO|nr:hypothetical protein MARPO_0096s0014 [Marchantia polymorpha]BBM97972.1 hypothetical protein Mp_1g09870 [Marchantia polymorpha subsp. ruderalis]|eukprot:PTQ32658.1 hypothetical protein MARPO_0096s0014 [Marchantia polymorpha]